MQQDLAKSRNILFKTTAPNLLSNIKHVRFKIFFSYFQSYIGHWLSTYAMPHIQYILLQKFIILPMPKLLKKLC